MYVYICFETQNKKEISTKKGKGWTLGKMAPSVNMIW